MEGEGGCIFVTKHGYIGRSRSWARIGDIVCLFLGCALPMVLRPVSEHYTVVAEAWVAEIMHGEAMIALTKGDKVFAGI
ncbi:hypothetical protein N431DRAFT_426434 [Stipitochalara longipes BDJ]|nr:hypothetical protein N431DRAFT_426434 [Stipitochalara longipes BDJ]